MKRGLVGLLVFCIIFLAWLVSAQETHTQATVNVIIPIVVEIHSPVNGGYYIGEKILLNVSVSEQVKFLEYSLNSGVFKKLCMNCDGYVGVKGFSEGENNLVVRALSYSGNYYYDSVSFYVFIPKLPVIHDTYPNRVTNGTFGVKYTELNLTSVILKYGPGLENSANFICASGVEVWCFGFVDVSAWQGKRIKYQFIVSNPYLSEISRTKTVKVDLTSSESFSIWNKILAFFGL